MIIGLVASTDLMYWGCGGMLMVTATMWWLCLTSWAVWPRYGGLKAPCADPSCHCWSILAGLSSSFALFAGEWFSSLLKQRQKCTVIIMAWKGIIYTISHGGSRDIVGDLGLLIEMSVRLASIEILAQSVLPPRALNNNIIPQKNRYLNCLSKYSGQG